MTAVKGGAAALRSSLSDVQPENAPMVDRPSETLTAPLRLDPTSSLSMIYLREFERTNSTTPGKVRIARKAGHMLRMHWAHVQHRRLAEWSGQ